MSKKTKGVLDESPPMLYEPFVVVKENEERAIRFGRLLDDIRDLSGRVLTIIDASIINEAQNKSIKDLIKKEIRFLLRHYEDICFYGKQGCNPTV